MLRSRFLWKVFACSCVPVLLVALLVSVVTSRSLRKHGYELLHADLAAKAFLARELFELLLLGEDRAAESTARRLAVQTGCRYTVVRADGLVLAESDRDPTLLENHSQRAEIVSARGDHVGTAVRRSTTTSSDTVYAALAATRGDRLLGWVRVSKPAAAVDRSVTDVQRSIALITLAALVATFGASLVLARIVTKPLVEITQAADAVSAGKRREPVPVTGNDEVAILARAFNRMAGQLDARLGTITRDRNELHAVLEGMVEGVVAVDREERVVLMTGVARRLLGIAPEGGIGRKIWEITRVPDVVESLSTSLREGRSLSGELILAKTPRDQVVEYQVAPIRAAGGAWTGAVLVLHDVSELRKMDQVRRDFVANVSHELKTPLTAIRGSVETVLDDPDMDPDTSRRFLTMIRENTSRLSALVTDLLALSRIESEEAGFRSRPVDLREPVLDSVRRLEPMAAARRITLTKELGDEPAVALGEREAIVEIADNLVTNALQYTRAGGTVAVRLHRDADAVLLDVEDTGIGIDVEHLDRIFERFYRVDKARSREVGGTGLGLSIVKHLVQAMHGTVAVVSRPGVGTTFTVRLRPATETTT